MEPLCYGDLIALHTDAAGYVATPSLRDEPLGVAEERVSQLRAVRGQANGLPPDEFISRSVFVLADEQGSVPTGQRRPVLYGGLVTLVHYALGNKVMATDVPSAIQRYCRSGVGRVGGGPADDFGRADTHQDEPEKEDDDADEEEVDFDDFEFGGQGSSSSHQRGRGGPASTRAAAGRVRGPSERHNCAILVSSMDKVDGTLSQWSIMPRYAVRSEGDAVLWDDLVVLESYRYRGWRLGVVHQASGSRPDSAAGGKGDPGHQWSVENRPELSIVGLTDGAEQDIRIERVANGGALGYGGRAVEGLAAGTISDAGADLTSGMRLQLHQQQGPTTGGGSGGGEGGSALDDTIPNKVRAGDCIRLLQHEQEVMLLARMDNHAELLSNVSPLGVVCRKQMHAFPHETFAVFLRPEALARSAASSMWQVEPEDGRTCEPLAWNSKVRLRHVLSGLFLSVREPGPEDTAAVRHGSCGELHNSAAEHAVALSTGAGPGDTPAGGDAADGKRSQNGSFTSPRANLTRTSSAILDSNPKAGGGAGDDGVDPPRLYSIAMTSSATPEDTLFELVETGVTTDEHVLYGDGVTLVHVASGARIFPHNAGPEQVPPSSGLREHYAGMRKWPDYRSDQYVRPLQQKHDSSVFRVLAIKPGEHRDLCFAQRFLPLLQQTTRMLQRWGDPTSMPGNLLDHVNRGMATLARWIVGDRPVSQALLPDTTNILAVERAERRLRGDEEWDDEDPAFSPSLSSRSRSFRGSAERSSATHADPATQYELSEGELLSRPAITHHNNAAGTTSRRRHSSFESASTADDDMDANDDNPAVGAAWVGLMPWNALLPQSKFTERSSVENAGRALTAWNPKELAHLLGKLPSNYARRFHLRQNFLLELYALHWGGYLVSVVDILHNTRVRGTAQLHTSCSLLYAAMHACAHQNSRVCDTFMKMPGVLRTMNAHLPHGWGPPIATMLANSRKGSESDNGGRGGKRNTANKRSGGIPPPSRPSGRMTVDDILSDAALNTVDQDFGGWRQSDMSGLFRQLEAVQSQSGGRGSSQSAVDLLDLLCTLCVPHDKPNAKMQRLICDQLLVHDESPADVLQTAVDGAIPAGCGRSFLFSSRQVRQSSTSAQRPPVGASDEKKQQELVDQEGEGEGEGGMRANAEQEAPQQAPAEHPRTGLSSSSVTHKLARSLTMNHSVDEGWAPDATRTEWEVLPGPTFCLSKFEAPEGLQLILVVQEYVSLRAVFDTYDADAGGTLDREELTLLIEDLGLSAAVVSEQLSALPEEATFEEFAAWWRIHRGQWVSGANIVLRRMLPSDAARLLDMQFPASAAERQEAVSRLAWSADNSSRHSITSPVSPSADAFFSPSEGMLPGEECSSSPQSGAVANHRPHRGRFTDIVRLLTPGAFNEQFRWLCACFRLLAALCKGQNSVCQRVVSALLPPELLLQVLETAEEPVVKLLTIDILVSCYVQHDLVFPVVSLLPHQAVLLSTCDEEIPRSEAGKLFNEITRVHRSDADNHASLDLRHRFSIVLMAHVEDIELQVDVQEQTELDMAVIRLVRALLLKGFFTNQLHDSVLHSAMRVWSHSARTDGSEDEEEDRDSIGHIESLLLRKLDCAVPDAVEMLLRGSDWDVMDAADMAQSDAMFESYFSVAPLMIAKNELLRTLEVIFDIRQTRRATATLSKLLANKDKALPNLFANRIPTQATVTDPLDSAGDTEKDLAPWQVQLDRGARNTIARHFNSRSAVDRTFVKAVLSTTLSPERRLQRDAYELLCRHMSPAWQCKQLLQSAEFTAVPGKALALRIQARMLRVLAGTTEEMKQAGQVVRKRFRKSEPNATRRNRMHSVAAPNMLGAAPLSGQPARGTSVLSARSRFSFFGAVSAANSERPSVDDAMSIAASEFSVTVEGVDVDALRTSCLPDPGSPGALSEHVVEMAVFAIDVMASLCTKHGRAAGATVESLPLPPDFQCMSLTGRPLPEGERKEADEHAREIWQATASMEALLPKSRDHAVQVYTVPFGVALFEMLDIALWRGSRPVWLLSDAERQVCVHAFQCLSAIVAENPETVRQVTGRYGPLLITYAPHLPSAMELLVSAARTIRPGRILHGPFLVEMVERVEPRAIAALEAEQHRNTMNRQEADEAGDMADLGDPYERDVTNAYPIDVVRLLYAILSNPHLPIDPIAQEAHELSAALVCSEALNQFLVLSVDNPSEECTLFHYHFVALASQCAVGAVSPSIPRSVTAVTAVNLARTHSVLPLWLVPELMAGAIPLQFKTRLLALTVPLVQAAAELLVMDNPRPHRSMSIVGTDATGRRLSVVPVTSPQEFRATPNGSVAAGSVPRVSAEQVSRAKQLLSFIAVDAVGGEGSNQVQSELVAMWQEAEQQAAFEESSALQNGALTEHKELEDELSPGETDAVDDDDSWQAERRSSSTAASDTKSQRDHGDGPDAVEAQGPLDTAARALENGDDSSSSEEEEDEAENDEAGEMADGDRAGELPPMPPPRATTADTMGSANTTPRLARPTSASPRHLPGSSGTRGSGGNADVKSISVMVVQIIRSATKDLHALRQVLDAVRRAPAGTNESHVDKDKLSYGTIQFLLDGVAGFCWRCVTELFDLRIRPQDIEEEMNRLRAARELSMCERMFVAMGCGVRPAQGHWEDEDDELGGVGGFGDSNGVELTLPSPVLHAGQPGKDGRPKLLSLSAGQELELKVCLADCLHQLAEVAMQWKEALPANESVLDPARDAPVPLCTVLCLGTLLQRQVRGLLGRRNAPAHWSSILRRATKVFVREYMAANTEAETVRFLDNQGLDALLLAVRQHLEHISVYNLSQAEQDEAQEAAARADDTVLREGVADPVSASREEGQEAENELEDDYEGLKHALVPPEPLGRGSLLRKPLYEYLRGILNSVKFMEDGRVRMQLGDSPFDHWCRHGARALRVMMEFLGDNLGTPALPEDSILRQSQDGGTRGAHGGGNEELASASSAEEGQLLAIATLHAREHATVDDGTSAVRLAAHALEFTPRVVGATLLQILNVMLESNIAKLRQSRSMSISRKTRLLRKEIARLHSVQESMVHLGAHVLVMKLVTRAAGGDLSHPFVEDILPLALQLGSRLLAAGNPVPKLFIFEHFSSSARNVWPERRFPLALRHILRLCRLQYEEMLNPSYEAGASGADAEDDRNGRARRRGPAPYDSLLRQTNSVFTFLEALCSGHSRRAQTFLRDQEKQSDPVNLVVDASNAVLVMSQLLERNMKFIENSDFHDYLAPLLHAGAKENRRLVAWYDHTADWRLLSLLGQVAANGFFLLSEMVQGPCVPNQQSCLRAIPYIGTILEFVGATQLVTDAVASDGRTISWHGDDPYRLCTTLLTNLKRIHKLSASSEESRDLVAATQAWTDLRSLWAFNSEQYQDGANQQQGRDHADSASGPTSASLLRGRSNVEQDGDRGGLDLGEMSKGSAKFARQATGKVRSAALTDRPGNFGSKHSMTMFLVSSGKASSRNAGMVRRQSTKFSSESPRQFETQASGQSSHGWALSPKSATTGRTGKTDHSARVPGTTGPSGQGQAIVVAGSGSAATSSANRVKARSSRDVLRGGPLLSEVLWSMRRLEDAAVKLLRGLLEGTQEMTLLSVSQVINCEVAFSNMDNMYMLSSYPRRANSWALRERGAPAESAVSREDYTTTVVQYVALLSTLATSQRVDPDSVQTHVDLTELLAQWSSQLRALGRAPDKVIASIELVGPDNSLQQLYFPVPEFIVKWWDYPEVTKARDELLYNVNRESAEEKIADFFDRLKLIEKVMHRQETLAHLLLFFHPFVGGKGVNIPFVPRQRQLLLVLTLVMNLYLLYDLYRHDLKDEPDHWRTGEFYRNPLRPLILYLMEWTHLTLAGSLLLSKILNSTAADANRNDDDDEAGDDEVSAGWFKRMALWGPFSSVLGPAYMTGRRVLLTLLDSWWPFAVFAASAGGLWFNRILYIVCVMDVVPQVRVMTFLIEAITRNTRKLLVTILLTIVILYVYATVTYLFFRDEYGFNGFQNCHTLSTCLKLHIDYGILEGPEWNGEGAINPAGPSRDEYPDIGQEFPWHGIWTGVATTYSLSYVIIVNLVLSAIVSGLIIDTFSEMRAESEAIEEDIRDKCFICSMDSDTFESQGIWFHEHTRNDHNMWKYFWFLKYLSLKDPLSFTGLEHHAFMQSREKADFLRLMPIKQSLALQRQRGHIKQEATLSAINKRISKLESAQDRLMQVCNTLTTANTSATQTKQTNRRLDGLEEVLAQFSEASREAMTRLQEHVQNSEQQVETLQTQLQETESRLRQVLDEIPKTKKK